MNPTRQAPRRDRDSASALDDDRVLSREVLRLVLATFALLILLSLVSYSPQDPSWSTFSSRQAVGNWIGRVGSVTADCAFQFLGLAALLVPVLLVFLALKKAVPGKETIPVWLGFTAACTLLLQTLVPQGIQRMPLRFGGGAAGKTIQDGLVFLVGNTGAAIVSVVFFVAMSILFFRRAFFSASLLWCLEKIHLLAAKFRAWRERKPAPKAEPTTVVTTTEPVAEPASPPPLPAVAAAAAFPGLPIEEKKKPEEDSEFLEAVSPKEKKSVAVSVPEPRKKNTGPFELPSVHMLSGKAESKAKPVDRNWYIEKANILVQKLKDFGVEGEVVNISPGPVITVYEFKPASGVKIKEIANLSDDLTLALSVLSVRIVAPIPGKPVVGIEIPSPHREMVFFKDLIQETDFYAADARIPIVLGRLASGEPAIAGLAQMPHLLVAGSTGTGKSVFINTLICSLLYRYTPQQLKLILVDPKMVELSTYEGIPHLLLPVVVDSKKAALALRWAVDEMERRYTLMHHAGVRHVDAYNAREPEEFLPYIVIVIHEYADLMAVVPKDVELSITRLAQKARAAGVHLVIATQRPSTDVVTGTIKANFPSRISFRVASSVDSKTILDRTGSDRLLGNGDMLFHSAGFTTLKRLQGAYLSDADLEKVVNYLKAQGEPEYDEGILRMQEEGLDGAGSSSSGDDSAEGQLYDRAVRVVAEKGEASISLIQRHLKIGYNRAAGLMEEMEKNGVVGPENGAAKRRTVLVSA